MARVAALLGALLLLGSPAAGLPQQDGAQRAEAARRLVRLEAAWERCHDAPARAQAVEASQAAARTFLQSGDLVATARQLDRGWTALLAGCPDRHLPPAWTAPLSFSLERWCIDPDREMLAWSLGRFYGEWDLPRGQLKFKLSSADERAQASFSAERGDLEHAFTMGELPDGDYSMGVEYSVEGRQWEILRADFSLLRGRDALADELEARAEDLGAPANDWLRRAALDAAGELRRLGAGVAPENGGHMAARVAWLRAALEAREAGDAQLPPPPGGEVFVSRPTAAGLLHLRARHPDPSDPRPRPLVIAVHGVGGSENAFFMSYGLGRLAHECAERGWIFAAPRVSPPLMGVAVEESVALARAMWPVDEQRVALVGYSLGALMVGTAASRSPAEFAGVAMVAGTSMPPTVKGLAQLPVFYAVGKQDFAHQGVKQVAAALQKEPGSCSLLHEFDGLEHVLVFSECTPALLDFLDEVLATGAEEE